MKKPVAAFPLDSFEASQATREPDVTGEQKITIGELRRLLTSEIDTVNARDQDMLAEQLKNMLVPENNASDQDAAASIRRNSSIRRIRHSQINSTVDYDTLLRSRSHTIRLVPRAMTRLIWTHSTIVRLLASSSNRHITLRFRAPLDTAPA